MPWPTLSGTDLRIVREPLRWKLDGAQRVAPTRVLEILRVAMAGPLDPYWNPPAWLMQHQRSAAQRLVGSIREFGGALLADVVGLGKTYVALAIATRYKSTVATVPAVLRSQWETTARALDVPVSLHSHESLSRGSRLPPADFIIVDEAHRFRNATTRRYDRLAHDIGAADVLAITATPIVNGTSDLINVLRLFLADSALAILGIPSLQEALEAGNAGVQKAVAPILVARSPRAAQISDDCLPTTVDYQVVALPTIPQPEMHDVLRHIEALEFPSFENAAAQSLLRNHLFYRMSSSAAAARETLLRHLAYVDRAISAATGGTRLSRAEAGRLFGRADALQFEMGLFESATPVDPGDLRAERHRLDELIRHRALRQTSDPKATAALRILHARRSDRTIIFTAATATAAYLAQQLGWSHTAVVSGGRARIATGRCAVRTALDLFSPTARKAHSPRRQLALRTLIATDMVSEGLDLQDADAVIHYDLPWTPLRLSQRLGRIRRIGTQHATSHVWWFAPAPAIEARLKLRQRVAQKVETQIETGVPATSRVGRSSVWNEGLEARELFCRTHGGSPSATPGFAVVTGPDALIAAVRWWTERGSIPELVGLRGSQAFPIEGLGELRALANRLARARPVDGATHTQRARTLIGYLRERLRIAHDMPLGIPDRVLSRQLMHATRKDSLLRNKSTVDVINDTLDRIAAGLRVGRERQLLALINAPTVPQIRSWCAIDDHRPSKVTRLTLDAVLIGDGSEHP